MIVTTYQTIIVYGGSQLIIETGRQFGIITSDQALKLTIKPFDDFWSLLNLDSFRSSVVNTLILDYL